MESITAENLLERFVEMYGEIAVSTSVIEDDPMLWRDYYAYSGEHMIRTDEGWEPGEAKGAYLADDKDSILDEVNAPPAK